MILFTESNTNLGRLQWKSGYPMAIYLLYLYLCGEIPLALSKGAPSHLSFPGDSQQQTAGRPASNRQTWAQTFRLYPRLPFTFKRKYFCCHCFPNQKIILRGSFPLKVRWKIRQDAPKRPSFHGQWTDHRTTRNKMASKIKEINYQWSSVSSSIASSILFPTAGLD